MIYPQYLSYFSPKTYSSPIYTIIPLFLLFSPLFAYFLMFSPYSAVLPTLAQGVKLRRREKIGEEGAWRLGVGGFVEKKGLMKSPN